jgi:serine/threonine protein kinase
MTEPAPSEFPPRSQVDLRAWVAKLTPDERAVLRGLLAAPEASAEPKTGPTVADEGPAPTPTPPGDSSQPVPEVPGYEIVAEIGRGGMGVVYQARQKSLNRRVAIKMILSGAAAGEQNLARFRAEAQTLARLQHPHIVQVFEVGECAVGMTTTCPYMVLEFCPGGSLAAALDGTPWQSKEAGRLIELLARAVHTAHQAGIVHRDLKPANILFQEEWVSRQDAKGDRQDRQEETNPEGNPGSSWRSLRLPLASWRETLRTPKITDFGLAKRLDDEVGGTKTGAILGTPEYMAPEQAAGRSKAIGPAADVYALGSILYELLTGRPPLRAETPLETLLRVMDQEPTTVRALNPTVPRDLETVCHKCLRKEPEKRYATALDLAEDLRRFLDGEPVRARPPGPVEQANRLLKRQAGLALAWTLFVGAFVPFAYLYGFFLPNVFATNGVSAAGFEYVALPTAALVLGMVVLADLRFSAAAGAALALLGGAAWLAFPAWRPAPDLTGSFLRLLAWPGLLAGLVGLAFRDRRLLLVVPILAGGLAAGWFFDQGPAAFLAGAFHGLVLGLLVRLVAWGLQRDRGSCALGAVAGAWAGLLVAEGYGVTLHTYLLESGLGLWHTMTVSLYVETFLAFAAAVVCGLAAGRRPGPNR